MQVTNYHTLKPFDALFQTGVPILTYHKVGPRPFKVRLKGLYVKPSRFKRQMEELSAAGYKTVSPADAVTPSPSNTPHRIVITFDDGYLDVLDYALENLVKHHFQAIQFLPVNLMGKRNEWDLGEGEAPEKLMDVAQVREWLAAGQWIGAHTLSHCWLSRLSIQAAREEIFASKKKLEDTFGVPIEHFCYPYGDSNDAVRDLVQEAGYHSACLTQFGINTPDTDRLSLKRITVRYPSLSFKALKARFFPSN